MATNTVRKRAPDGADLVPAVEVHGRGCRRGAADLVLLKDATLSSNAGLQLGPEPRAGLPNVGGVHAVPLLLHGGIHGGDVGVVDVFGLLVHVVPHAVVERVQVAGVGGPDPLRPEPPGPQLGL